MPSYRQVAQALNEMAALLRHGGELKFKADAYDHAAQVVETLGGELAERVEEDRLRDIQGIGPGLSRQIQELWNTGSSQLLRDLRAKHPPGTSELLQVSGMTPRRIRTLYESLGVSSVEELRAACLAQRVRGLPGLGEKTEAKLLEASQRWAERAAAGPEKMLLSQGLAILHWLRAELGTVVELVSIAGAARRGEELLDELAVVVVGDGDAALSRLTELRRVVRVERERGLAQLADGIALRVHPAHRQNLGTVWVRATGSAEHLEQLEARAPGLLARDFSSEPELYEAAGVPYVPPEQRQGGSELGRSFEDLLDVTDVLGLVHCHTTYSDGRSSVLEMAQAAHALGMQYVTITDHSPTARYASGVSIDDLKRQWDEIAAAQEVVPIRILRGAESDILSDGLLDYPDAVLEQLDVVIASIHARYRQDRATMTARLTRALELPLFKIWGHALGRILNHRDVIDCDVPALLDVLARSPGAIELNADPHRLDLPPRWIPAARERGIPFVISVDAHSTAGFQVLGYGVTMARRGGLERREVLNTLPAAAFAAAVNPTRAGSAAPAKPGGT